MIRIGNGVVALRQTPARGSSFSSASAVRERAEGPFGSNDWRQLDCPPRQIGPRGGLSNCRPICGQREKIQALFRNVVVACRRFALERSRMSEKVSLFHSSLVSRRSALAVGLTIGLFAETALAAGKIVWKRKTIKEGAVAWRLRMEVHLPKAPSVSLIPLRFSFTPVTYFERALMDGREKPILRKVALRDQQAIVERVDVGFRDPSTGKTARRTRFTFDVDRDHGFAAGVYEVKVTDSRTGKKMGSTVRLTLAGDNKVIDRRSMVIAERKKKPASESGATSKAAEAPELTPDDDAYWEGGGRDVEGPAAALPPPAHLREKPGCGCRVAGESATSGFSKASGILPLSLVGALVLRRRQGQHEPR